MRYLEWLKLNVNIINTWCILMSEAVTVPSLMMMTLIVSEESFARDTHTYTHTHTHTHTRTYTHPHTLVHTHRHTHTHTLCDTHDAHTRTHTLWPRQSVLNFFKVAYNSTFFKQKSSHLSVILTIQSIKRWLSTPLQSPIFERSRVASAEHPVLKHCLLTGLRSVSSVVARASLSKLPG